MVLNHQVGTVTNKQPVAEINAALFQILKFFGQTERIDHQTVADYALHAGAENAGRCQMQDILLVADFHRMTGVIAALITDDPVRVCGQNVNDFAFTFIAPLSADQNCIRHVKTP